MAEQTWTDANQAYLMAHVERVRLALERHGQGKAADPLPKVQAMPGDQPAALDQLIEMFGLSPFERDLLLLCAGMDLDSRFPSLCATAQGDPQRSYPTFSLALATLPGAHWSAIAPAAPLRYWYLIELEGGRTLTHSPLRLDERILHYLTGVPGLDERLANLLHPVPAPGGLVPSHRELALQLAATWAEAAASAETTAGFPALQLSGNPHSGKQAIAAQACALLDLTLYRLPAVALPTQASELSRLLRLWQREAALGDSALLLDCDRLEGPDPQRESAVGQMVEGSGGLLVVVGQERRGPWQRPALTFDVRPPEPPEQRMLWHRALGPAAASLDGQLDQIVAQFDLDPLTIQAVAAGTLGRIAQEGKQDGGAPALDQVLWDVCRSQARPRLEDLAQRITPVATWQDLVLPARELEILREIAVQVGQRGRVYDAWEFRTKGERGLGISALFAGTSGTGKTMAAEVLANELRLDLYRIDLSAVVSKYIGETEKNLRRVFDAAEAGGAILLFDEADALFGKRSEVKDSHDRHANIEVSYLLQRMEAYRGLAILTTNMKDALDTAFLRRIRFVVQFPFPRLEERAAIWQRIFPAATPTQDLDMQKLAQLNVTGGNIRNIALYAAFLAADDDLPVGMSHLLRAARREYGKLERQLANSEIEGWSDGS